MIVDKKFITADEMRISIAGRIDVTTSPQLREEIAAIPPDVKKNRLRLPRRELYFVKWHS